MTTSKGSWYCLKGHTAFCCVCVRTRGLFWDLITHILCFLFVCYPVVQWPKNKTKDEWVQTSYCMLLGSGRNYQVQSNPCSLGGKELATRSNLPYNRYHLHIWCTFWRGFVAGKKRILHNYNTTTYHCGLEKQQHTRFLLGHSVTNADVLPAGALRTCCWHHGI